MSELALKQKPKEMLGGHWKMSLNIDCGEINENLIIVDHSSSLLKDGDTNCERLFNAVHSVRYWIRALNCCTSRQMRTCHVMSMCFVLLQSLTLSTGGGCSPLFYTGGSVSMFKVWNFI